MITFYNKFTGTFTASSSLFDLNILQTLNDLDGLRALLDNLLISLSFIWKNASWSRWRFLTGLQGVLRALSSLRCQSNSWWITFSSFSVLRNRANISVKFNKSGPYPIHVFFTNETKPLRCQYFGANTKKNTPANGIESCFYLISRAPIDPANHNEDVYLNSSWLLY